MDRPKVIVNIASSLDGVIASNKGALTLSNTADWVRVHKLRNSVDAILIGINTVLKDDPFLTVRYVEAKTPGPLRIVLDSYCKIPLNAKILQKQNFSKTLIVTSKQASIKKQQKLEEKGISSFKIQQTDENDYLDLLDLLKILKKEYNIQSLLVEGGTTVITQFIKKRLVDLMHIFYAPVLTGAKNAKMIFNQNVVEDIEHATAAEIINIESVGEGFLVSLNFKEAI